MSAIGVTGHQNIPAGALAYVTAGIRDLLGAFEPPVTGVGSLAAGADQLFAAVVADLGGRLDVVVPCDGYDAAFGTPADARRYRRLLSAAASVEWLPFPAPSEEAFMAAGIRVVERCSVLLAVWDGRPAAGRGGTADVVAHARSLGRPVHVLWPAGVTRS
ncbi:hypothetical protein ACFO1B_53120 [Dactylosporangium siamense]|uniref:Uncharacterized protein n=1 Tax=Dactylosporangium siamense TaxID=685454 RepID=A0A919UEI9_9ACTN|nr:hypothetical protein [Dactylosporangium siamense]GIG52647.1 hypothetical protein Dsi01nite_106880 [Dactylosporangium siamense]